MVAKTGSDLGEFGKRDLGVVIRISSRGPGKGAWQFQFR